LASGSTRGTIAVDELGHGDPVDRVRTRAKRKGGQWRLHGLKPVVLDGATADWVLVPARTQEGLGTFLIEAPQGEAVPTWDHTRRVARLELDGRAAERIGGEEDDTAAWRRIVDDANVALCCDLLGVMEQAHHLAVEYAKVRVQFDRPIATFQVIKHKAVDMLHAIELTRVGTHYAAWASDRADQAREGAADQAPEGAAFRAPGGADEPRRAEAVAMAKGYAAEAANAVCGESIQIHGGVGFTWDCDAHLFYRRAKQDDLLLGSGSWHHQRLADQILTPGC
jgi:alkylation response protein AidB-like acyl-CoA dehydrogenase